MRTDTVCQPKSACCLHASTDVLYPRRTAFCKLESIINGLEVLACEDFKARDHALSSEIIDSLNRAGFGDLYLECALAKAELKNLGNMGLHLRFKDDILTGDT